MGCHLENPRAVVPRSDQQRRVDQPPASMLAIGENQLSLHITMPELVRLLEEPPMGGPEAGRGEAIKNPTNAAHVNTQIGLLTNPKGGVLAIRATDKRFQQHTPVGLGAVRNVEFREDVASLDAQHGRHLPASTQRESREVLPVST
jgi:hypothetical protein